MSKTPQSDAILALEHVHKDFGHFKAVDDVSFSVQRGEVFGFLGPNGAGKSTTIRMILDILRPTAGSVRLFGQDSRGNRQAHRRLGYLSGDMVMDISLTGRQYLEFVAAQYGGDQKAIAAYRDRLAHRLESNVDVPIGNYSRGNRQKIGLIAALQHHPELLILDEPTSGFDPLVQEQFAALITEFKQAGSTVFMSSHILTEVQDLCDRVAFIKDGRIADTTTVQALMARAAKQVVVKAPMAELKELRVAVGKLEKVRMQAAVEQYELTFAYGGEPQPLLQLLARFHVQDVVIREADLEEIFIHYYQAAQDVQDVRAGQSEEVSR